jgi:hypothetical protein
MSDDITGFRIDIPDADLDDLRQRLRQTRWPEPETVDDWSQGIPLAYVRQAALRRVRAAGGIRRRDPRQLPAAPVTSPATRRAIRSAGTLTTGSTDLVRM